VYTQRYIHLHAEIVICFVVWTYCWRARSLSTLYL